MVLDRRRADELLADAVAGRLHTMLAEQARLRREGGGGSAEVRSWQNSLPAFLSDVVDAGLGHLEVLLEHKLPHSTKRIDVVLCGTHPRTGDQSYLLVELKQWSKAEPLADDMVRIDHYTHPVLHPVEQIRRYCQYLVDSTPALEDRPGAVQGLAYLHNAHDADIWRIKQYKLDEFGQLYTLDSRAELITRMRTCLDPDPGSRERARQAADDFLNFWHAPTKPLLAMAEKEIRERDMFVLLDEQRVAFSTVRHAVERAQSSRQQTVVIVIGGPGSGKSVIALSLLGELARAGRKVVHATGSRAFTETMRKVVGSRQRRVQSLFKYFNNFTSSKPKELDAIICDEAHRLRETSVSRFSPKEIRDRARRQVQEIIDAAYVPVFLLDERQIVRPGEMGTPSEIRAAAEALNCAVETIYLAGQYRCGGSEFLDAWVARLLGLGHEEPIAWSRLVFRDDETFVVRSAGSPAELESWLLAQRERAGGTARVAAGFCWRWSDPVGDREHKVLVPDVKIGDWERPWNAKPEQRVPDAPPSHFWASDDRGFGQVGCIYTAQGFEYDWAGVIFGPDFVRRDGRWVAQPRHSHDPAVKRANEAQFHALIRNTYKVLLTRGMRGVCVYSTDPETQEFLAAQAR